jgi:hypothetical protein
VMEKLSIPTGSVVVSASGQPEGTKGKTDLLKIDNVRVADEAGQQPPVMWWRKFWRPQTV